MKKICTLVCSIAIFITISKAQYVTIPDANFRAYLVSTSPSCFNASQMMDTSCTQILSVHNIILPPSLGIVSLEGLQYFKNLTDFSCYNQPTISFIPGLDSLTDLSYFNCSSNQLTSLPAFPARLSRLICSYNQLASLPELTGLTFLQELDCSFNQLTELPDNHVDQVLCHGNNIYCLSNHLVQASLLQIDTSKIKCLKYRPYILYDEFHNMLPWILPGQMEADYPICTLSNNVNNCFISPVITGKVFYDNNSNGVKDPSELYRKNATVQLSSGETGYTDINGQFYIYANSIGTFGLTVNTPTFYSIPPPAITVTIAFGNYDTINLAEIPMQPAVSTDSLNVSITPTSLFRPGQNGNYHINYENLGTTTVSPAFLFHYNNSLLTYTGSDLPGVINNINTLTFSETNFVPGQQRSFNLYFSVSTSATMGTAFTADAALTANAAIATDTMYNIITASYDPNDKTATPTLSTSQVNAGKYIDYIIRFQNTGNDTAFNIVLADTLSDKLLANTLQMVDASHLCEVTQNDKYVFFKFTTIMLPDSNVNEPLSHGFVKFRIKAKTTLPANDVIPNAADIYFDYNIPVLTNTASTIVNFTTVPLSLLSFKGYTQPGNSALLNWTTANEVNTKSFEIEQSTDSRNFNFIATVVANGRGDNSYMQKVNMPADITYYRLKMVDIDGKFNYSPIIKISINKNASGIVLMGNPVKGSLMINVTGKSIINTTATIINNLGAVVKTVLLKEGLQSFDVGELAAGNYFIKTKSGLQKFMVIN